MSKTETIVGVNSGLVMEQGGHNSNESSPHRPPTLRNTLLPDLSTCTTQQKK